MSRENHGELASSETFEFSSTTTKRFFNFMVDAFIQDYMTKRYSFENSGWRGLSSVAREMRLRPSSFYGRHGETGPILGELVRRGLVETRVFPGERGRGGEVTRVRVAYEREPVREYVTRKIKRPDEIGLMRTSPAASGRIAVLPFVNLSPDHADEYFSDGMTDELISVISNIGGLSVISRTSVMSFKGTKKKLSEIARELDVGTVLEGSVRRDRNRLRITIQLLDASTDRHLWSKTYDRELEDVFAIQRDIAENVANALKLNILGYAKEEHIEGKAIVKPETYIMYLKGLNAYRYDKYDEATEYFNKALELEPDHAAAMAWKARVGSRCAHDIGDILKARELVQRAIALDDANAEAHVVMSFFALNLDADLPAAEQELRRAIEIDPNLTDAHCALGILLTRVGRRDEALAETRKAVELDPLYFVVYFLSGFTYFELGMYDQALLEFDKASAFESQNPYYPAVLSQIRGATYVAMDKLEEGVAELEKAHSLFGEFALRYGTSFQIKSDLGYAYAISGRREGALRLLEELKEAHSETRVRTVRERASPCCPAMIYAGLGDKQAALDWLKKTYEENRHFETPESVDVFGTPDLFDFAFRNLRKEPEFEKLLKKIRKEN